MGGNGSPLPSSPGSPPTRSSARIPAGGPERVAAWVAVWQDGLVTPVRRGENADRTLRNERVVRWLARAAEWRGGTGSSHRVRVEVDLDPRWADGDLGVAAFLTDPATSRVLAARGDPKLAPAPP